MSPNGHASAFMSTRRVLAPQGFNFGTTESLDRVGDLETFDSWPRDECQSDLATSESYAH